MRPTVAVWLRGMPCTVALAVIVRVDELVVALEGALKVSMEDPPAVICVGWKVAPTPAGTPETLKLASCVKPFVLESETWKVTDCPGRRVAELGTTPNAKVDEDAIVKVLDDVALSPLTETVIGPLAAPLGMTNERIVAV
jgi:hypothetical protein